MSKTSTDVARSEEMKMRLLRGKNFFARGSHEVSHENGKVPMMRRGVSHHHKPPLHISGVLRTWTCSPGSSIGGDVHGHFVFGAFCCIAWETVWEWGCRVLSIAARRVCALALCMLRTLWLLGDTVVLDTPLSLCVACTRLTVF